MYFWILVALAALALNVAILWQLHLRGGLTAYPVPYAYCAFALSSDLLGLAWMIAPRLIFPSSLQYNTYYWSMDLADQAAALLLMTWFIRLTRDPGNRYHLMWGWAVLLLAVLAFSLLLASDAGLASRGMSNNRWMTAFSRNLRFGSALLNFAVWAALLSSRRRSLPILLLAAGLGLLVTGKALGLSMRLLAHGPASFVYHAGSWLAALAPLLAAAAWYFAFRAVPRDPGFRLEGPGPHGRPPDEEKGSQRPGPVVNFLVVDY